MAALWRKAGAGVMAFSAVLVVLLWTGFALFTSRERDLIVRHQFTQNLNLARAFAESVAKTLAEADRELGEMAAEYGRMGPSFDIAGFAQRRMEVNEAYTAFRIVDGSGAVALQGPPSNERAGGGEDVLHSGPETNGLIVSAPARDAHSGRWVFFVSRRIKAGKKTSDGFVSAGLDAGVIASPYGEVDLGKDGLVALVGRDGVIRARRSNGSTTANQRLMNRRFERDVLTREEGLLTVTSSIDGITRLEAFRAVKNYPLVILVGTSEAGALADFHARRTAYAGILALMTLLVAGFALTSISHLRRLRERETSLREREQQFRLLTDNVPVLIAHLDAELRFRYANLGYRDFFLGESAPSIEGKCLKEVALPHAWREIAPFLERALQGNACSYAVKRQRKLDGTMRDLEASLVPDRDDSGNVTGIYVLLVDATERRHIQESLRLRNRALESSLNAVNITRIGESGQEIVYVNPSFERITGYAASEVIGKDPWFLHGEDRDQIGLDVLRRAIRARSEATVLLRNYRKDGTLFWNELRVAPVLDEDGRVTHMLGLGNDVTERVRYQQEVERNANFDALTGLPNRNLLNDRIGHAIAQAARSGHSLAVLFVDLDQLKRINDSLGHEMGDNVIVAVGKRIADALRSGDTVARLGGDEFVALLSDLKNEEDAGAVASKVLAFINTPIRIGGHEFALTASIGVALYPKDGDDAATLLRNADTALYRAKEEGRNCFRFFASEMNERIMQFVVLERDLRHALKSGQFELYYQPIVSLADRRRVGAEALIRWRRADGAMMSPAEFIPVAEDSGLIVPIGQWVMDRAMQQVAQWNRDGHRLYASINLSVRQFRDASLVDTVRANLRRADIDPASITLEITESAVMQSIDQTIEVLSELKALGVKLSLDDFGTGYSSLAYLKRFPIDILKIDRGFVRDVTTDRGDQALSRTIIELGRSLGITVVAEGVETQAQARFLAKSGCLFAQGYLFGRPMDPTTFASGMASRSGF